MTSHAIDTFATTGPFADAARPEVKTAGKPRRARDARPRPDRGGAAPGLGYAPSIRRDQPRDRGGNRRPLDVEHLAHA